MKIIAFLLVLVLGITLPLGSIAEGYTTYSMTGQVRKTLESNPLDRDYKRDMYKPENGTTVGRTRVEGRG
jgi:hypothetical protein